MLSKMVTKINLPEKFYLCRDTAKMFAKIDGIEYAEIILPVINLIKHAMELNNVQEVEAFFIITKLEGCLNDLAMQILFMAALVELIEPSI